VNNPKVPRNLVRELAAGKESRPKAKESFAEFTNPISYAVYKVDF
jgi:hypothetical protein